MSQGAVILLMLSLSAQAQQEEHALAAQAQEEVKQEHVERYCLSQALYYEARGEGIEGQLAVADVILQRQRSKYHPDTICGVVYQPYQFSFVMDGSMLREIDVDAWNRADDLSGRILRNEVKTGLTGRALFYHAKSVRPDWADSMIKTAEIGNHIFYRRAPRRS
jgi:spore germination cell wall hydrolase CwlJ-like protein